MQSVHNVKKKKIEINNKKRKTNTKMLSNFNAYFYTMDGPSRNHIGYWKCLELNDEIITSQYLKDTDFREKCLYENKKTEN